MKNKLLIRKMNKSISKLSLSDLKESEETNNAQNLIRKYDKVKTSLILNECRLQNAKRFEVIFESAAQAMLQITIFFQTEEQDWNWLFVAGILTSFISLANGFSTFYTALPTEEVPVPVNEKLTFCQHFTLVSSMVIFTSTR